MNRRRPIKHRSRVIKTEHREVVEEGENTVIVKSWKLTRYRSGTYGGSDEDMHYEMMTRQELWKRQLADPEYLK